MATTDSTLNIADPGSRTGSRSRPKSTMDIQSSMKGIMSKVRETYSEESPLKVLIGILLFQSPLVTNLQN
jgi:hypothetical protein